MWETIDCKECVLTGKLKDLKLCSKHWLDWYLGNIRIERVED